MIRSDRIGFVRAIACTVRRDGLAVALSSVRRTALATRVGRRAIGALRRLLGIGRDPGERAAERFLKLLGYRILARNWRSPRDARDEADLIARSPDGDEVVLVEVKRTATDWDPLARVDRRKREVLWRIAMDLEALGTHGRARGAGGLAVDIQRARAIRIDLVAVRGAGRTACVCDHLPAVLTRTLRNGAGWARQGWARQGSGP